MTLLTLSLERLLQMCLITFMICLQLRDKHGTVQFKNRHSDMQSIYFIAYEPGGGARMSISQN